MTKMSAEEKDSIAQEKFGKNFDELEGTDRQSVGGTKGGGATGGHAADPEHAPPPPEVKFGEKNSADDSNK